MSANTAIVIIFLFCILGPSMVFAAGVFSGINALGRNPSSAPKIFTAMVISLVFTESLAIIGMLIAFQIFSP
ncbi:MAG: hypothetical protein J7K17_06220 [Candidatus Omnitrophica bacterium]|nr:hypothetical protein [Candidatus Omnitrophota bacterium]